jgi:putative addiction module CopG family antidote
LNSRPKNTDSTPRAKHDIPQFMATNRTIVNISTSQELDGFLLSWIQSSRYQTTSEVVREARRLLERQDRELDVQRGYSICDLEAGANGYPTAKGTLFHNTCSQSLLDWDNPGIPKL